MRVPSAEPERRVPLYRCGAGIAVALGLLLASGCQTTRPEDDPVQVKLNDVDSRVTRVERIISNQSLVDLAQRLDAVQAENRQLRGRIEELEYKEDALRKQQKDFYNDLDKRVGNSAGGGAGAGGSAGGAAVGGAAAAGGALAGGAGAGGSTSGAGSAAGAAGSNSAPAAGSADTGAGASSEEQTVYSQSFDALKAGSYSVAITGFKDFLKSYPSSPLAENAQYWLGEAYYVTHDLDDASSAFRNVVQKWPNSRKSPDALLKLGYTQLDQKKTSEGRATLSQVVQKYPGTDAARLANEKLQRAAKQ
jgi:tol-pal system protein YbgF